MVGAEQKNVSQVLNDTYSSTQISIQCFDILTQYLQPPIFDNSSIPNNPMHCLSHSEINSEQSTHF